MLAKDRITKELERIYDLGEITAGQVYKGFDFDGVIEASGWWFAEFSGNKVYLGNSVAAALETIEQYESADEYLYQ